MSEWTFYFQPNIWGDPSDPDYTPFFSKSEQIGDQTLILIIHASELEGIPHQAWHKFLETEWENYVASAQPAN